jgi:hypothetical protein
MMTKIQKNLKAIKRMNKTKKLGQLPYCIAQSSLKMALRKIMLKAFAMLIRRTMGVGIVK